MKYYGIHVDYHGSFWVEDCEAKDLNEAHEKLERNDTNLIVFAEKEARALVKEIIDKLPTQQGAEEWFHSLYPPDTSLIQQMAKVYK